MTVAPVDTHLALWGVGIIFALGVLYKGLRDNTSEIRIFRHALFGNGKPPMFLPADRIESLHEENSERLDRIEERLRQVEVARRRNH